jgi:hypothetical protein
MDKTEARQLLQRALEAHRSISYAELVKMVGEPTNEEVRDESGTVYQLEVQAFWDDQPGGNLRILAAIDDGGWRAFAPLSDDFILAPDGSFVGE